MADEKKKSSDGDAGGTLALLGLALLLMFVVLIPLTLALAAWYLLRQHMGRREYWTLSGLGLLGWGINYLGHASDYTAFLKAIVQRSVTFSDVPVVAILLTAMFFLGAIGITMGTPLAKKVPERFVGKPRKAKAVQHSSAILPTDEEKKRISVVKPIGGTLTVNSNQHSILNADKPGKRLFPLGLSKNGTPVYLSEDEVRMHGLILGSTGSGKSKTIEALAGALLDLGWSGMILDLKEDTAPGGLRDWCATYAQHHSIPYQELRLSDPNSPYWFNPVAGMAPDEIRDTILALNEFDDQHWQALSKQLLGQMVNLCTWAHEVDPTSFPAPTMYDIGTMLGSSSLPNATKKHRAVVQKAMPHLGKEDFAVLANPSADQAKAAFGIGAKLALVYDTQAGRTVLRPGLNNERRLVDVTQPGLTYVGLDSQGKADLTSVISAAVLQRMSVYAAQRTTGAVSGANSPRFLIVDEANWVNRTIVQSLLSRARSAGIAMFLCTQGPMDWIDKRGDDWGVLAQNMNIAIIMSQGEQESAKMCAEHLGHDYKEVTSRSKQEAHGLLGTRERRDPDGRLVESVSSRDELAYIVEPDELRRLRIGEAIIRVGKPENRIEWAKIQLRDPKTSPHR